MSSAPAQPFSNPQPGDEHIQALIGQNLALCQTTRNVRIDEIANTSSKAHERIDKLSKEVWRMNDPEVGQVTKLWEDREYVQKATRDLKASVGQSITKAVISMLVLAVASGIINFIFVQRTMTTSTACPPPIDKTILKDAIKAALAETIK